MNTDHANLGDAVRGDLSMTDRGYRNMVAARMMPQFVTCPECGEMATFRHDLAARYECQRCGHAVAAMWADSVVAGTNAPMKATRHKDAAMKRLIEVEIITSKAVKRTQVRFTRALVGPGADASEASYSPGAGSCARLDNALTDGIVMGRIRAGCPITLPHASFSRFHPVRR